MQNLVQQGLKCILESKLLGESLVLANAANAVSKVHVHLMPLCPNWKRHLRTEIKSTEDTTGIIFKGVSKMHKVPERFYFHSYTYFSFSGYCD